MYRPIKNELFYSVLGKDEFLDEIKNIEDRSNITVICIHDPDVDIHSKEILQGFHDVLQIKFWDLESDIGRYNAITSTQGKIIRDFIQKNKDSRFLVHCMAGISRSAGVACAIECIVNYNGNDFLYKTGSSDVKNYKRYSPNYTVYDAIIKG